MRGGGVIVLPLLHKVGKLKLTARQINVNLADAVTRQGIKVAVQGVATFKIGADDESIRNAAERFLESQEEQVDSIVKNVLEGSLRSIVGTLTVEELNLDRMKFQQAVQDAAKGDLATSGLQIDSFTIQAIRDESGYMELIGQQETARRERDARMAKASADQEAAVREAEAEQVKINASRDVALRRAETETQTAAAQARAAQAGPLAEAEATQEVTRKQTELAQLEAARKEQELVATHRPTGRGRRRGADPPRRGRQGCRDRPGPGRCGAGQARRRGAGPRGRGDRRGDRQADDARGQRRGRHRAVQGRGGGQGPRAARRGVSPVQRGGHHPDRPLAAAGHRPGGRRADGQHRPPDRPLERRRLRHGQERDAHGHRGRTTVKGLTGIDIPAHAQPGDGRRRERRSRPASGGSGRVDGRGRPAAEERRWPRSRAPRPAAPHRRAAATAPARARADRRRAADRTGRVSAAARRSAPRRPSAGATPGARAAVRRRPNDRRGDRRRRAGGPCRLGATDAAHRHGGRPGRARPRPAPSRSAGSPARRPSTTPPRRLAADLRAVPGIERFGAVRLGELERSGPRPLRTMWRIAREQLDERYGQLTIGELIERYAVGPGRRPEPRRAGELTEA